MDDCGGGYSESVAEMCDELQNGSLPLLIGKMVNTFKKAKTGAFHCSLVKSLTPLRKPNLDLKKNVFPATPNGREEAGTSRDCFIFNPSLLDSNQIQSNGQSAKDEKSQQVENKAAARLDPR